MLMHLRKLPVSSKKIQGFVMSIDSLAQIKSIEFLTLFFEIYPKTVGLNKTIMTRHFQKYVKHSVNLTQAYSTTSRSKTRIPDIELFIILLGDLPMCSIPLLLYCY